MSTPLAICRRLMARLAPLLALVGFVALAASALHYLEPDRSHTVCAVCILGSTPAAPSIAIAAPVPPAVEIERRVTDEAAPPRSFAGSPSRSRAPPEA